MNLPAFMLCLVAVFISGPSFGQDGGTVQPISPNEAIGILKNGTLVVRLSTNTRKIEALEKLAATTTKEKDRLRFQTMLEKTRLDTRNQNLWLMEAFQANYSFSKLLFMPDTAATDLKSGVRQGIFLNGDLQTDPSLALEGDFLVAYYGANTSDQYTNNEGITVLDKNFQPVKYPFPFFTGRTSIRRMFEEAFNKTTDLYHYTQLVIKFQKKLTEF